MDVIFFFRCTHLRKNSWPGTDTRVVSLVATLLHLTHFFWIFVNTEFQPKFGCFHFLSPSKLPEAFNFRNLNLGRHLNKIDSHTRNKPLKLLEQRWGWIFLPLKICFVHELSKTEVCMWCLEVWTKFRLVRCDTKLFH